LSLVLLSPDIAAYFPDEQTVNTGLAGLIGLSKWPKRHAIVARAKKELTRKGGRRTVLREMKNPGGGDSN
jgi:hypothetical protein